MPCAEAILQFVGRGADDAYLIKRQLQRVGTDLCENRFMALARAGRADIDIEPAVKPKLNARMFLQAAGAALNERSKPDAVEEAVDLAPLNGLSIRPADFLQGLFEDSGAMAGVK